MTAAPLVQVRTPDTKPVLTPKLARLLMQMAREHADRTATERAA